MDEVAQKPFVSLTVSASTLEGNREYVESRIAEAEKEDKFNQIAVKDRSGVKPSQEAKRDGFRAQESELRNSGFTEEDPQLQKVVEKRIYWEQVSSSPDTILMGLESDLEHSRSKLQYWQSKLRRIEFLEKQAKAEVKGRVSKR